MKEELPNFLTRSMGEIRIAGHRIGLYNIIDGLRKGEDLAANYPSIEPELLDLVIQFCHANPKYCAAYYKTLTRRYDEYRREHGQAAPTTKELKARFNVRRNKHS